MADKTDDEKLLRECYDYIRSVRLSNIDTLRGIGVFSDLRARIAPEDIPKSPPYIGLALS